MLEHRTQQEARSEILNKVLDYYVAFLRPNQSFEPGDRIPYAARVFNEEELINLVDSALEFWLTGGRYADSFESELAQFLRVEHCSLVNSGSSANLLAFMSLTSPLLGSRRILPDDEVITVAAGFPTTIAPIVQYGAVPIFVDVTIPQYNVDVNLLEQTLSPKTKAVMLAHTLGNPFDVAAVKSFCNRNRLWLIEDNCDSLGSKYVLGGAESFTGTFGDIGTSSFYPPHHITMGEGGAVYTNDALLHRIVRSLRDWGRDCACPSGQDDCCGNRFGGQYGELPEGYDHKYIYSHFGYNLKATDMQAAIGCAQLKKLPDFINRRIAHFDYLKKLLENAQDDLILPQACPNSTPSWFGFALTCKQSVSRNAVVRHLEQKGVQTRMLFAGNLLKQPCFDGMRATQSGYRVAGDLTQTDRIMNDMFWVGVYPGLIAEQIEYMARAIKEAVARCRLATD